MLSVKIGIIQFTFILTIIFVIAKLLEVITWSWWMIFLPAMIGVAIGALIMIILLAIMIVASEMDNEG